MPIIDLTVVATSEGIRKFVLWCDGHSPGLRMLLTIPEGSRDPLVRFYGGIYARVGRTGSRFVYRSHVYCARRNFWTKAPVGAERTIRGVPSFEETERTQSVEPQGRTRRLVELILWTCWWVLGKNYADRWALVRHLERSRAFGRMNWKRKERQIEKRKRWKEKERLLENGFMVTDRLRVGVDATVRGCNPVRRKYVDDRSSRLRARNLFSIFALMREADIFVGWLWGQW